jgi:hypothetical protein
MLENENEENKPRLRGRPRKHGITNAIGDYFRDFEDSVVLYNSLEGQPEKDKLFREKMYDPLRVMTQTILRRYFRSQQFPIDMTDDELIVDTMSFIVGILDKFDSERGYKCYSYIQAVIKHYLESVFRGYSKIKFKKESNGEDVETVQRTYNLDEVSSLIDLTESTDNSEHNNLINAIIKETIMDIDHSIDNMEKNDLSEEDCLVGNAIINILTNYEEIFSATENTTNKFTKSVVLYRISEMTLLDQKDIKISLKKYKEMYKKSKQNLLSRY